MSEPTNIDWKLIFGSTGVAGVLIFLGRFLLSKWDGRRRLRIEIRAHHVKRWDCIVSESNPNPHWEVIATGFGVIVTNIGREVSIAKINVTTRPSGVQIQRWQPSEDSPVLPQLLKTNQSLSHIFMLPTLIKDWQWEHPTVEVQTACGKTFPIAATDFIRQFNLSLTLDPDSFSS